MYLSKDIWMIIYTYVFLQNCTVSKSASCANTRLKWPLFPTTCLSEISSIQKITPVCPLSFTNSYPIAMDFNFSVMGVSYFDLKVPEMSDILDNNDYGFTIYINPLTTTGAIIHYKADDQLSSGSIDMKMWMENGLLKGSKTTGSLNTPDTVQSQKTIISGIWQKVGLLVDSSGPKLRAAIDDQISTVEEDNSIFEEVTGQSANKNKKLVSPGILRIGGTVDASIEKFEGSISCVGFVKDKKPDCLAGCSTTVGWTFASTAGLNKGNNGHFVTVVADMIPSMASVAELTVQTLSECALKCIQEYTKCLSFVFSISSVNCKLYSDIYISLTNFQVYPEATYYKTVQ